jgi:hypothetical protein
LLDVFYETLQEYAPGAWELNEAMLALWDPEALSNDWILPDNFHVHIKVMTTVKENVHFLNKPYEVSYSVNAAMEGGRSLGANMTHSIDGMIVREITRRCMYNPVSISRVATILKHGQLTRNKTETSDDKLVKTLWQHYEQSGFLSARILDHLNDYNVKFVDVNVVLDLIDTLPKKPFQVIAIHDCFRCLPNYANDLRYQYNLMLSQIAKSELLSYLISQIVKRPVKIGKLDDNLHKDILETNYALS